MTMSAEVMEQLEQRGLDVEIADHLGWASTRRDGRELVVIPFYRGDRILRRKIRNVTGEKYFSQDAGAAQIPWNENALKDESLLSQALIITEGEFDALTAIQCGFPRTISVPNGAPPPRKEDGRLDMAGRYQWLKETMPLLSRDRAPEIILAVDGDDNGAQLLHDLASFLERFRCKFLTYPKHRKPDEIGRERCKDLNEGLQAYGARGVVETLQRAQWIRLDGVYRMEELPPAPAPLKFDIGFSALGENYTMRLGDLTVVTGVPGLGKTTFVNDLCCRVAQKHNLKIAWASFEQMPQRDHRRSLRRWHANTTERWLTDGEMFAADAWIESNHLFIVPGDDEDVTLDWLLDRMEMAAVQNGANVLVIDPWNEMDHVRERDETLTEYVGRAIKTFRRFARRMQVHVIVVAHPAKLQKVDGKYKPPTLYDISDSANWYNKCDVGIIVHREDAEHTDVKVQKSRYHEEIGVPGEVRMAFCKETRRFIEQERLA